MTEAEILQQILQELEVIKISGYVLVFSVSFLIGDSMRR